MEESGLIDEKQGTVEDELTKAAEEIAREKINDIIDAWQEKHPDWPQDQIMSFYGDVFQAVTQAYIKGYSDAKPHTEQHNALHDAEHK